MTIEPFQGLLLGLFFLSVGASLDLSLIFSSPVRTLGLAAGFIAIKAVATYAAGRLFRFSPAVTLETALMLAPGGEFALVVIASAIASRALGAQIGGDALVAVTLSMFVVPLMGILVSRLPRAKVETDAELAQLPTLEAEGAASKAIIVGYGRVGQLVGEMLKAHAIDFIVIETGATPRQAIASAGAGNLLGRCIPARVSRPLRHCQRARPDRYGRRLVRPPRRSSRRRGRSMRI